MTEICKRSVALIGVFGIIRHREITPYMDKEGMDDNAARSERIRETENQYEGEEGSGDCCGASC